MINYAVTILGILWVLRLERRGAICRQLLEKLKPLNPISSR
jgi:hypothetical protein